jgi:hypothetical protein
MTGPSVAERPPTLDRERVVPSVPATEVSRRSTRVAGIFSGWKEALRFLSVWVGAGLVIYLVGLIGWLVVRSF